jgi:alpha-D-ribose 1-methylphosphonate 5-triphosphate synthase subunit PhnH
MNPFADLAIGGGDFTGLEPGFADPVRDAQACFRTVLDAMAHPGRIASVPVSVAAPPPLGVAAATIALTLCDIDTPIWLDGELARAAPYLAFLCGAPVVGELAEARFAFSAGPAALPPLDSFPLGTDEYPDRSATLVIEVPGLVDSYGMPISGPGIRDAHRLGVAGLPARFWAERSALAELFPRGLDMIFVSGARLVALPRSTRLAR